MVRVSRRFVSAVLLALALGGPAVAADTVTVFAAASLKDALDDAAKAYKAKTGVEVKASYAASSALAKQIEAGAPADLFISADTKWMDYVGGKDLIQGGEIRALAARKITEETCRKFNYRVGQTADGTTVQIAPYYDSDRNLVAQKLRPKDKSGMFVAGKLSDALLFGQQLWSPGGRKIVVTEGEIDALTVSQVQGNKCN